LFAALVFFIVWVIMKKSVQEEFAIAFYILAFEAFTMGTVQAAAIGLNMFQ
jgi:hypothetical protein